LHSTLIYLFCLFNVFVKHYANTGLNQMALDILRHSGSDLWLTFAMDQR